MFLTEPDLLNTASDNFDSENYQKVHDSMFAGSNKLSSSHGFLVPLLRKYIGSC